MTSSAVQTMLCNATRAALLGAALLILPGSAAQVSAEEYVIDTQGAHASINFRIQHLGYSWLAGRFDSFSGTFSFDDANPGASTISVEIDTKSVNSNHAERDKHLRSADFLNVDVHPKATFVSTSVEPTGERTGKVTGDLTLNGVTKPVVIDVEYIGGGKDPWGGFRQGFAGKTQIVLADFGINFNLGPASKAVDLELHVEGIKK